MKALLLTSTLDGGKWSTSRPGRFTLGEEPLCLLNSGLDCSQRGSGWILENRKFIAPFGIQTSDRPRPQLVTLPITLSQLQCLWYDSLVPVLALTDFSLG